MIVGVSDEDEGKLEEYVKTKSPGFAIVRAPGAMESFGGRFYPSFFTIGADGTILTTPEERIPSNEQIEEALASVVTLPDLPDDSRFSALRKDYEKRRFKKVAEYFDRMLAQETLDLELRMILEAQRARFLVQMQAQIDRIEKLQEGPDYRAASRQLEALSRDYKGLPVGAAADAALARFEKDATIKKEIAAGDALAKLLERFDQTKSGDRKKLLDGLQQFRKKYKGTRAAEDAARQLSEISRNDDG